jgi:hypothetical protein
MQVNKRIIKLKFQWMFLFIGLSACVDQIDFRVPAANSLLVVEGMISDLPGHYEVKLSRAFSLNDSAVQQPVEGANITLFDDQGNQENFTEIQSGVYNSSGIIRGEVGHRYFIRIQTINGNIFESEPDELKPVGEIQNFRYEYEARTKTEAFGEVKADVFNIYLDAHAGNSEENYVRWKYKGTYKVLTNPELRLKQIMEFTIKDPVPCSGYIVVPALYGGRLEQVSECTCCTCWASQYETAPLLSDGLFISNNEYKNLKIAEVPINAATFYDKFLVEVDQMSMSRKSFEFFRLVRAQKEGASSLFQPPSASITGNIKAINSSAPVVGIFWASSVKKKSMYIDRTAVPYPLPPIFYVTEACTDYYPNSTTTKPANWE